MTILLNKNSDAWNLFIFVFFPLWRVCVCTFGGAYHCAQHTIKIFIHSRAFSLLLCSTDFVSVSSPGYIGSVQHVLNFFALSFYSLLIFFLVQLQTFLFRFILKLCSNFRSNHLSLVCVRVPTCVPLFFEIYLGARTIVHYIAELSV